MRVAVFRGSPSPVVFQERLWAGPSGERGDQSHPYAARERQGTEALDEIREAVVGRIADRPQGRWCGELVALALDQPAAMIGSSAAASDQTMPRTWCPATSP